MNWSFRSLSYIANFFFLTLFLPGQSDIDHAYLGVHTSRLDRAVSHQLGLPNGLHLQVERVAKGSSAEDAGLQLHDILLKFDDQILVNPEQLKTLVRLRNPGERVNLAILRQSKPLSLSVELMEAPEDLGGSYDSDWFEDREGFGLDRFFGPNDRLRDLLRRHSLDFPDPRQFHNHPFFTNPRGQSTQPQNLLDDPLHGGGTDVQSYSYSSSTQQITVNDEEGSLQWTEKDGLRFLRAADIEGNILFEGPINTPKDRSKIPSSVLERLQRAETKGELPGFNQ
jgi:hypothetical protein